MSRGWHILDEGACYTLSRRVPVRFDVVARTTLPMMRKDRLARQVRQDMWRALQSVRGFAPVVQVREEAGGLEVAAGGMIASKMFPKAQIEARIVDMLEDADRRARWLRWAS